jgi:hypothetical protein
MVVTGDACTPQTTGDESPNANQKNNPDQGAIGYHDAPSPSHRENKALSLDLRRLDETGLIAL